MNIGGAEWTCRSVEGVDVYDEYYVVHVSVYVRRTFAVGMELKNRIGNIVDVEEETRSLFGSLIIFSVGLLFYLFEPDTIYIRCARFD